MVAASTALYFAYGSNLFTARLRKENRAPSAEKVATARLAAYTLRFHKKSNTNSGKCDAYATGCETDKVHGVVFRIIEAEIKSLDSAEACGYGYDKAWVDVETDQGDMRVFTYVASHTHIDTEQLPFPWYKKYVIEGACEHKLPAGYVAQVRDQATRPDPDLKQQREHDEFIERHRSGNLC